MLKLYNLKHELIGQVKNYKDLVVERDLTGYESLSFSFYYNDNKEIIEECYIQTEKNEYIVKSLSGNSEFVNCKCKVNIENLEGSVFETFEQVEQKINNVINLAIAGTGWIVGSCDVTKLRTCRKSNSSAWDIIQECRKIYKCDYKLDSINKKIFIHNTLGTSKGVYFSDQLNLRQLEVQSDSYDFATRLIPIGKDGLKIGSINNGKDYVENFQYTNKIITKIWEDNRYTVVENLKEDAGIKLAEMSKPQKSYKADIIDLAKLSIDQYSILDFDIGDTITIIESNREIRESQRAVKIQDYLEEPEKNTLEISNILLKFEDLQRDFEDTTDTVNSIITDDGNIDESKIPLGKIKLEVNAIVAEKADIGELNAATARIGVLEATKATITDLTALNATIINLQASKADITELHAISGKIDTLESDNASIQNLVNENLVSTNALIQNLNASKANITDLNAVNIKVNDLVANKANITDLTAVNAEITNLKASKADIDILNAQIASVDSLIAQNATLVNANIDNLKASKADIIDLNAVNSKVNDLTVNKASIADLTAVNAEVTNLKTAKADVDILNAGIAKITSLEASNASINNLLAGNLSTANFQAGAITAGSSIIADSAIGSAQISCLDAGKINAGIIDTSRVTVQGANAQLKISGNRLQIFEKNNYERVALGDVNGDGSVYGFRVRGEDGKTVLMDENGVYEEGITDGSIKNSKISEDANIDGTKLNITTVVTEINNGDTHINGSKVLLNDKTLDIEISDIKINTTYKVEIISTNGAVFKNNIINTTLLARVYHGAEDITDTIDANRFRWTRISDDSIEDKKWNDYHFGGTKQVSITSSDVYNRATFRCDILDNNLN